MNQIKPPTNGYEEGLEEGRRVADSYVPSKTARIEHWRAAFDASPTILSIGRREEEVRDQLRSLTQGDINAHARVWHARKMAAFPSLEEFPELEGMDEYFPDRARGFAEGAGIDLGQHALELYWPEIFFHICWGGEVYADDA